MKIRFFLVNLFFVCYILNYNLTFAQEASLGGSLSPEIKDKLQVLQAEIASKAASLKQEINQKLLNRAYIGFIKDITDSKLTLTTQAGDKTVIINQDTDYLSKTSGSLSKKILLKNLSVGDFVAALGDADESEILTAKRIVKFTKPIQLTKKIIWGKVQTISDTNLMIKSRDNQILTVAIDSSTNLKMGSSLVSLSKINQGSTVVVAGQQQADQISANLIYIFSKP